jgi:hypothetical protein
VDVLPYGLYIATLTTSQTQEFQTCLFMALFFLRR